MSTRIVVLLVLGVMSIFSCGSKQKPSEEKTTAKKKQEAIDARVETIRDDALRQLGDIAKQLDRAGKSVSDELSPTKSEMHNAHNQRVQSLKKELEAFAIELDALSAKSEKELEASKKEIGEKVDDLNKKTRELNGDDFEKPTPDEPESAPVE